MLSRRQAIAGASLRGARPLTSRRYVYATPTHVVETVPEVQDLHQATVELDVEALYKRLEARAKAMVQLEDQEVASRTKVKFILKQKVGLGECWKIAGKCPELGNMLPEIAPFMQWNNGDVWTLEAKIRPGNFVYKAVLRSNHNSRKPDGQYLWDDGKERILQVPFDGEPATTLELTDVTVA